MKQPVKLVRTMADECRVRVRGREGEEVEWSRKAARRAERLKNWLDDLDPSEHSILPIEETATTVLRTLGEMCDDDWSASSLEECSLTQLAALIEGATNLIAEQALEYAQCAFASRLEGKCAHGLLELLGAVNDFESDEERAASLREPAFMPDSPTTQYTAARTPALPVNDDAAEAALAKVGVGTLIELKGVNRAWRTLARRALCSRLCRREGRADPRQLDEITELNLEPLIEAGRPWEAARAGRLLVHLERLTGYGFAVDVAAVREIDLERGGGRLLRLLRGPVKHALCSSCVTGEGEPPLALLLGAIACAGSGGIRGIPVEQMRADAFIDLNFEDPHGDAPLLLGPEGAMLLASFLPVMGGLTSLNLSFNQLCGLDYRGGGTYTAEGITAIADAMRINGALTRVDVRHNNIAGDCAEQLSAAVLGNLNIEMFNEIPIKEMRANSITGLDLMEKGVGVEGGMVVAGLIPVMGALTSINLRGNELGDKGWGAIFAAICGNKDSKIMSMDVSCENISPACVKLIAEALRTSVTGGLTRVDVRHNNIAGDGAEQLAAAVLGTLKIEMFNEIPIKEMRANSITELDLNGKGVGVEGGMVVAGLIPVMGGLTSLDLSNNLLCGVTGTFGGGTYTAEGITAIAEALRVNGALTVTNLLHNQLDEASAKMLAEVAKQRGISLCGIQRDRTTADFSNKFLMPPDAILLASDLSQAAVTGGLTKISLAKNELGEEGTKAICEALEQNKTLKELDIRGNRHRHGNIGGSAGAKHVAKMLGVNGGLTSLDLSNNALCGVTFMGGTYTAEGITAIAHALRVNGALKSIDLSGNQLCGIWTEGYGDQQGTYTAEGITAIADALRVNGGLTSIDLSNNQLCGVWTDYRGQHGTYTAEGITAIADAMRVNGGLTSIDLSGNQLCGIWTDDDGDQQGTYTAEGITAIADALRVNGALTSINLRGNELGDKGWGAIFAAICGSKDSKIMSLDASCENISPAGVQLIAEALRTSVTGALTRVDVRHNNIAGDGAVQLAAAVLGNFKIEIFNEIPIKEMRANSITELDLNGKDFGVEGVMVVAGLIPVMGALTSVWTSAHDSLSSQY